jgi:hypothetical protein
VAQYCDSKKLEKNWLQWIISSSVPTLEPYREKRLLWTKIVGTVKNEDGKDLIKNGGTLPDPGYPVRHHCLLLRDLSKIHFSSDAGDIEKTISLPGPEDESLLPFDEHNLQYVSDYNKLLQSGYILEPPTASSWHNMLSDINNICIGIANKMNQPSEEERNELANEALYQVMRKLNKGRLVYTPGRAPVFNLLTTTIHRCMYSILNKRTSQRNGMHKLFEALKSGSIVANQRSFKIQTQTGKIKSK